MLLLISVYIFSLLGIDLTTKCVKYLCVYINVYTHIHKYTHAHTWSLLLRNVLLFYRHRAHFWDICQDTLCLKCGKALTRGASWNLRSFPVLLFTRSVVAEGWSPGLWATNASPCTGCAQPCSSSSLQHNFSPWEPVNASYTYNGYS